MNRRGRKPRVLRSAQEYRAGWSAQWWWSRGHEDARSRGHEDARSRGHEARGHAESLEDDGDEEDLQRKTSVGTKTKGNFDLR